MVKMATDLEIKQIINSQESTLEEQVFKYCMTGEVKDYAEIGRELPRLDESEDIIIRNLAYYSNDVEQIKRLALNSYACQEQKALKILFESSVTEDKIKEAIKNRSDSYNYDKKEFKSQQELDIYMLGKNIIGYHLDNQSRRDKYKPYATGFKELDSVLDGGLHEGLYILGAISSLGKTTLALQIADQIAESGRSVLFCSLEMSKYEVVSKSISRLSLEIAEEEVYASTTRDIMMWRVKNEKRKKNIFNSIKRYSETIGESIRIFEGTGDVGVDEIKQSLEVLKEHNKEMPVVFIDYLQILKQYDMRATDKQNIDKAVSELKRISRDYKIPVFIISSFNRSNYSSQVNMSSFKESGAIEYSSDVLLGLQFANLEGNNTNERLQEIDDLKKRIPREVELKVLKNRNGRTGDSILYDYDPRYNLFKEQGLKENKQEYSIAFKQVQVGKI